MLFSQEKGGSRSVESSQLSSEWSFWNQNGLLGGSELLEEKVLTKPGSLKGPQ